METLYTPTDSSVYCTRYEFYGCEASSIEPLFTADTQPAYPYILQYTLYNTVPGSVSEYTGICSESYCSGGVGKLIDGQTGMVSLLIVTRVHSWDRVDLSVPTMHR